MWRYSGMLKSQEIVVKSEWTTSWLRCATFVKTTQDTAGPVLEGGTERWWLEMGMGGLVWSIDGKSSKDKNQYLQGGWKFPQLPNRLSGGVWLLLLPAVFYSGCPFISCQNPSFNVLTPELFIIQIENRGNRQGVNHTRLGIRRPPHMVVQPTSHHVTFLYRTSLAPLCMWVSVCSCVPVAYWCIGVPVTAAVT